MLEATFYVVSISCPKAKLISDPKFFPCKHKLCGPLGTRPHPKKDAEDPYELNLPTLTQNQLSKFVIHPIPIELDWNRVAGMMYFDGDTQDEKDGNVVPAGKICKYLAGTPDG